MILVSNIHGNTHDRWFPELEFSLYVNPANFVEYEGRCTRAIVLTWRYKLLLSATFSVLNSVLKKENYR